MKHLWIYQELSGSKPTLYGTFLTKNEAHDMMKGYFSYRKFTIWHILKGLK